MNKTEANKIQNLNSKEAVEKLKEIIKGAEICMFATTPENPPLFSRPMSPVDTDDEGCIWFFSPKSSNKNSEIRKEPQVHLTFSNWGSNEYLSISGNAEIIIDKKKFDEKWSTITKVWFPNGKDDPELSLIKVTPYQTHYWDTKHNKMVALLKMVTSIATGKTMDDGVEGELRI